jgi:hypothetical protein
MPDLLLARWLITAEKSEKDIELALGTPLCCRANGERAWTSVECRDMR